MCLAILNIDAYMLTHIAPTHTHILPTDAPTKEEQSLAEGLIKGIAAFYPCSYCRKDFQECVKKVRICLYKYTCV